MGAPCFLNAEVLWRLFQGLEINLEAAFGVKKLVDRDE